ncbi:NAD(P)/FAD-dependent oxidoreductase [Roseibium salinum]|uniref:NAD(P)/FAD-dependent oxidoreductase n=1 Tax=Roseibium salinum TaxID=1604349 RepID=A0ABT3QYM0_9HYPH|nr:NAD(P)/FAD-dependent oxidoreductase [Roseibium sp. DSM 29163]MCX2721940.1 NAD(P)/FAD-dependent oxidoreductase [Roseibium sp. DSM 29163]MDN3720024.1 NAD(P)/FAD-dependent oxidoreductase [Roseibium salinum]
MHDIETVVVGAGVIGLACARALALTGREVMVLEQHGLIGSETSARNSEVIHAGIYYPTGSLKARLCVSGKELLYRFCAENGVGHERIGKLIVAASKAQLKDLERIRRKAAENGVTDLVFLDRRQLEESEPALACQGALLSPSTGIIDSHGFMLALQGGLEAAGGQVVLNTRVERIETLPGGGFRVHAATGGTETHALTCRELIVAAGHGTPAVMSDLPQARAPETFLAKGSYFKLQGKAPFSRLIYPVPEPGGLGVHLTFDLQHQARFGPDVEWVDSLDYPVDPARGDKFYAAIRAYWPDLADGSLVPDYSGIRPKIAGPGEPAADFHIDGPPAHGIPGLVAFYGMESPGLTSALAIGNLVTSLP